MSHLLAFQGAPLFLVLFQLAEKVDDDRAAVLVGYVLDDVTGFHHFAPVVCEAARNAGACAVCKFGFTGYAIYLRKVIAGFVEIDHLSADIAKDFIDSVTTCVGNSYMHRSFSF